MTIADQIRRAKTDYDEVYEAGYEKGKAEGGGGGYDQGFEAGKQAEYDAFWDTYQENGNRTDYSNAFAGYGWTTEIFKPKYDIVASAAYMIFQYAQIEIDLEGYLQSKGLRFDISKATNTQYLFQRALFTRIGVVDVSSSTNSCPLDGAFNTCSNLVTIDKIVLKTGSNGEVATSTFMYCNSLKNVIFEGVITNSNLRLQWSTKLSKASINSVVNALSTTSSGQSVTLSETAVNKAFETSEGANDGSNSDAWLALVATKSNWTISLV